MASGLDRQELGRLGAELGSDVTFFFHAPAAWCTGRGEMVEPLAAGPTAGFGSGLSGGGAVHGRGVFAALTVPTEQRDAARRFARPLASGDIEGLGRQLHNRLAGAGRDDYVPRWRRCAHDWRSLRPAGVLMSGSGSTVFALAVTPAEAMRIARALTSAREVGAGARVFVVRSCD